MWSMPSLKHSFFSLPLSVSLQIKAEVTEDVYTSRKKQHQTMMHYFCALNTLQYKKKISLLEPLLGYMQAQVISDSESCGSERRCKSTSWRLMYWNPLQDHCKSSAIQGRKWRKRPTHPLLGAAEAAALTVPLAGAGHCPLTAGISLWNVLTAIRVF